MKVLIILVVFSYAAIDAATFNGYIQKTAIPLAKKIYEAESTSTLNGRIYGGTPSRLGRFPYQAGLIIIYNDTDIGVCGGTLISRDRVMTAAHCLYDGERRSNTTTVVLGSLYVFSGGTRINASNIVLHPDFDVTNLNNDLAIIYLPEEVTLSDTIAPIALPSGRQLNETYAGTIATLSGYGVTEEDEKITLTSNQTLRDTRLMIITRSTCSLALELASNKVICTIGLLGRGPCVGDSGDPLVVTRNSTRIVVGITSYISSNYRCGDTVPAVYTRIPSYIDFVKENLS